MSEQADPIAELCARAAGERGSSDALDAIIDLRARLDELERQHVANLLGEGATFAAIAQILGISRQAAHERFRRTRPARPPAPPHSEIRRILVTGTARGTVRLARKEAAALGASAVGTEHLLLALTVTAPEPVARVLSSAGIDEHALRTTLQPTLVADGEATEADGGFTVHAREVLEGSLREAVERGEGFIGADHLLFALLRNPAGGAAQTLAALDVEPRTVLDAVAQATDPEYA